ncbi:MAG: hypothetical protein HC905_31605 [Bacteroidales bacterium]|nr:hypothetical protein [Bacteroidales bacterium]
MKKIDINRNNYEIWFIDYYDGRLDALQIAEMMAFISENQDIEEEFYQFQKIGIPAESIQLHNKLFLKRNFEDIASVTDENFEEFCIAHYEGDLDVNSENKLQNFIKQNPTKEPIFQLYQQIRFNPELSVFYSGKNSLKKTVNKPVRYLFYAVAVAASIIGILFLVTRNEPIDITQIYSYSPLKQEINENFQIPEPIVIKKTDLKTSPTKKIPKPEMKLNLQNELQAYSLLEKIKPVQYEYIPVEKEINVLQASLVYESEKPENKKNIRDQFIFKPEQIQIPEKIDLWALAEVGVKGVNYLTESNLRLEKKTDPSGKIVKFEIGSENFGFSTQRKR